MTPYRWLALIGSLLLITFIIWFLFWLRVPTSELAIDGGSGARDTMIVVDIGDRPDTIALSHKMPVRLGFRCEETASRVEKVAFADLNRNANRSASVTGSVSLRQARQACLTAGWL